MAILRQREQEAPEAQQASAEAETIEVKHYQEDDSVFLNNEYLIKGVAGGILWRLLKNHAEQGRTSSATARFAWTRHSICRTSRTTWRRG